jgi:nucleoside-diphosphate-sugar epimerase
MSKLIVILGITGTQGSSIATHFLGVSGFHIRGITRTPSNERAVAFASQGVEIISADFNDASSLRAAFEGSTVIFAVTDFWGSFYNPATTALLREGQSVSEYCYELELQQGKNIVDAAAMVPGLQRFVFSSCCDASRWSNGNLKQKMDVVIIGNYMSNSKTGLKFYRVCSPYDSFSIS